MLNEATIRALAPQARPDYVAALTDESVLDRWGWTTPRRQAVLLATGLVESGGFTIVAENMNYLSEERLMAVWPNRFKTKAQAASYVRNPEKLAELVYGARMGNERDGVGDGDGYAYRGRGPGQLTGYDNYVAVGAKIGVDIARNPELVSNDAKVGLEAACAEYAQWMRFADGGEKTFRAFSNGVNRGNPGASADPIGWEERLPAYRRVCKQLGISPDADGADDVAELGESGELIKGYQQRLTDLGYTPGAVDGYFGERTRAAVFAFQAAAELPIDGKIGQVTRTALGKADAPRMSLGDRAQATGNDLVAAGSTTIPAARGVGKAGEAIATISAIGGAQQMFDPIGVAKTWTTELGSIRGVVDGGLEALRWSLSHSWIAAIVLGFVIIRYGNVIERARVLAHQLGLNLGR